MQDNFKRRLDSYFECLENIRYSEEPITIEKMTEFIAKTFMEY